ncbi:MAG: 50S ribosome-binding protein YggL [Myxococcota bacterium]
MQRNHRVRGRLDPEDPRQFGFSFRIGFAPGADGALAEQALRAFVAEALAPAALELAGSASDACFEGFVTRRRNSATLEDRRALHRWLRGRPEVREFHLGSLVETARNS